MKRSTKELIACALAYTKIPMYDTTQFLRCQRLDREDAVQNYVLEALEHPDRFDANPWYIARSVKWKAVANAYVQDGNRDPDKARYRKLPKDEHNNVMAIRDRRVLAPDEIASYNELKALVDKEIDRYFKELKRSPKPKIRRRNIKWAKAFVFDGLTLKELADKEGCSIQNVQQVVNACVAHLRERFASYKPVKQRKLEYILKRNQANYCNKIGVLTALARAEREERKRATKK